MPVSPTPISSLPTPPSRSDPANFATRGDAFMGALPTFQSQANSLATNVYNNAVEAEGDAVAAAVSEAAAASSASLASSMAAAAAAAAGAQAWVSGTTYQAGAVVYSPLNFQGYRRKTTGAGTLDPSTDPTNWAALGGGGGGMPDFILQSFGIV